MRKERIWTGGWIMAVGGAVASVAGAQLAEGDGGSAFGFAVGSLALIVGLAIIIAELARPAISRVSARLQGRFSLADDRFGAGCDAVALFAIAVLAFVQGLIGGAIFDASGISPLLPITTFAICGAGLAVLGGRQLFKFRALAPARELASEADEQIAAGAEVVQEAAVDKEDVS